MRTYSSEGLTNPVVKPC